MWLITLTSLVALATAANFDYQKRWSDKCGDSKYPDAGLPSFQYIIGGKEARPHEYPWQAALRYTPGMTGSHSCGAIIISERYILTATHCIFGAPTYHFDVVVGDHDRSGNDGYKVAHEIDTYHCHQRYGKDMWYDSDISLIRLKEPIQFSENVYPVCAPDPENAYVGKYATVSGWGTTTTEYWAPAYILRALTTLIPPNWACEIAHGNWGYVTDNMICGGKIPDFKEDSCNGDSGGPLVVKSDNEKFELAGIVSWGAVCASGPPGVYIRTGNFLDWIDSKMALHGDL